MRAQDGPVLLFRQQTLPGWGAGVEEGPFVLSPGSGS